MATFIDLFSAEVARQRASIEGMFSEAAGDEIERALREGLRKGWRPLPGSPVPERAGFAVDGSEAVRGFSNGAVMVMAQGLLIGPALEDRALRTHFVRGTVAAAVIDRLRSLSMRYLELDLARSRVADLAGGVLYLDGALHSVLPHLLYPLGWNEDPDLPLAVLEAYLDLLDLCRLHDVILLAVSKTSRAALLGDALLHPDISSVAADVRREISAHIPDAEILERWGPLEGYTRPLLVGTQPLGNRRVDLLREPERILDEFQTVSRKSRYTRAQREELLARTVAAPAMISTYLRAAPGEDCLRVDLPNFLAGGSESLGDFYLRWADVDIDNLIRYLIDAHGGAHVYNAAVYTADQLVRLSSATVDGAYLAILRGTLDRYVQYNRSRRRFL